MPSRVELHTRLLTEAMARAAALAPAFLNEPDFVELAVLGERLRRLLALADIGGNEIFPDELDRTTRRANQEAVAGAATRSASDVLARYDALLADPRAAALAPADLANEVQRVLDALAESADKGTELLDRLDRLLCTVGAAYRCRAVSTDAALEIAARTRRRMRDLAPRLEQLWDAAATRFLEWPDDEQLPGLHGWVEELAALSAADVALSASTIGIAPERREEIFARFLRSVEMGNEADGTERAAISRVEPWHSELLTTGGAAWGQLRPGLLDVEGLAAMLPGRLGLGPRVGLPLAAAYEASDLAQQLRSLTSCAPYERASRFARLVIGLEQTPCPWLHTEIIAAIGALEAALAGTADEHFGRTLVELAKPQPGRAPLLASLPEIGGGTLLELRVRVRQDDARPTTATSRLLGPVAWRAIRTAFLACSALAPLRLAPASLEEHELEVIGPSMIAQADGASIGLAAALALVSLWTGQPLPADLVAVAQASTASPRELLAPVGSVRAKVAALGSRAAAGPVRALIHPDQAPELAGSSITPVGVESWRQALEAAGLLPGLLRADLSRSGANPAERARALAELVRDAKEHRIAAHRGLSTEDGWLRLATEIEWLAGSLAEAPGVVAADLVEARAVAALAYGYGGDLASARALLGRIDTDHAHPFSRVLLLVAELAAEIADPSWPSSRERCDDACRKLSESLAMLYDEDRSLLRGIVLGTQGRALMHQRRLDEALPLLQAAVAHHCQHVELQHELARSRVYLAMALRMAGRAPAALAELDAGLADLDRIDASRSYEESTEMFLRYERARALLALGQHEEAIGDARRAVELGAVIGWRPLPGVLRALVWALRGAGREDEATEVLALLERVVEESGRVADRAILEEARGGYREDGVVA